MEKPTPSGVGQLTFFQCQLAVPIPLKEFLPLVLLMKKAILAFAAVFLFLTQISPVYKVK